MFSDDPCCMVLEENGCEAASFLLKPLSLSQEVIRTQKPTNMLLLLAAPVWTADRKCVGNRKWLKTEPFVWEQGGPQGSASHLALRRGHLAGAELWPRCGRCPLPVALMYL